MSKSFKLDIFEVIKNIDLKIRDYYDSLSEEEQKAISPYVIMRWLSGTSDMRQVFFLNELVNPYAFELQKHKDLLLKLMMVCTSGKSKRYTWLKQGKKAPSTPKLIKLVQEYFGYNSRHAAEAIPLLSDEDLISFAEQLAYQKKDISELKKELKKR